MYRAVRVILFLCALIALRAPLADAQTAADKPRMAEDVFKNLKVLRGMSVSQFMATMGFFSASLGENCTFCHVQESGGSWDRYADDNQHKETARKMVTMMNAINKAYFAGRREVTCYSCHRGGERPVVTPSLAELYGPAIPHDPDDIREQVTKGQSADQILDKHLQAIGGEQSAGAVTSYIAKGKYAGYAEPEAALEIYAKAPNLRTMIVHKDSGDVTSTYDGRNGWSAAPLSEVPVPLLTLGGADLDAAKVEADLAFPARIKASLTDWHVGYPTTIDDRDVLAVQGLSSAKSPVKLYFDKASGLLVRAVHYTDTPIGLTTRQLDYTDYRDVSGVKMPYKITITWFDGRATIQLESIQANVAIDAAKFAKPAEPRAPAR